MEQTRLRPAPQGLGEHELFLPCLRIITTTRSVKHRLERSGNARQPLLYVIFIRYGIRDEVFFPKVLNNFQMKKTTSSKKIKHNLSISHQTALTVQIRLYHRRPGTKFPTPSVLVNKVLLGHCHVHLFIYPVGLLILKETKSFWGVPQGRGGP